MESEKYCNAQAENLLLYKNKSKQRRDEDHHVLIIHTGGTIGMVYNDKGLLNTSKEVLKKRVLTLEALNSSKDFDNPTFKSKYGSFTYYFHDLNPLIDSSDMNHNYYTKLIGYIANNYEKYSSFVILHGTDTMAYTTPMVSLFIENLSKPIFITGSAYSIFEVSQRSDAYENLLSTFNYVCNIKKPGVYLSFSGKLFSSKSVKKFSCVITDMFFYRTCLCESPDNIPKLLTSEYEKSLPVHFITPERIKLASLYITPLDHINVFERVTLRSDEILLIHGYGNGNIPVCNRILDLIRRHSEVGGISIVISQCPDSYVKPLYSSWEQLLNLGVISSGNMTIELLASKLSYLKAKKVPDSLLELLIFISFDRSDYYDLDQKEFCKILMKILEKSGHMDSFFNSYDNMENEQEILEQINAEDLKMISKNPIMYYKVFKRNQKSMCLEQIFSIDSLIIRSMFLCFEILLINKFVSF